MTQPFQEVTLQSLMSGINAQLEKSAADSSSEECTDDDNKKSDDTSSASKDDKKKDDSEGKSKDDKSDDKSKDEKKDLPPFLQKKASDAQQAGADLAAMILEKTASQTSSKEDPQMNKQAQAAGEALADQLLASLLTKQAGAGDITTADGITPEGVPNGNQVDNAALVAEDDAKIKPMPGLGGSVNQILDAIVQDTMAQGAASTDQVHTTGVAAEEGDVAAHAVPNQVPTDEQEKVAAVQYLVEQGVDFYDAVDMVKQADTALVAEADMQIKQAAIGALMDRGVDFADAVALVKEAGRADAAVKAVRGAYYNAATGANAAIQKATGVNSWAGLGRAVAGKASGAGARLAADARALPGQLHAIANPGAYGKTGRDALAGAGYMLRNNRALQAGAAGTAALAAGGAALAREKKAAFDALVEAGVDFDTAADLVDSKSKQIYGA